MGRRAGGHFIHRKQQRMRELGPPGVFGELKAVWVCGRTFSVRMWRVRGQKKRPAKIERVYQATLKRWLFPVGPYGMRNNFL